MPVSELLYSATAKNGLVINVYRVPETPKGKLTGLLEIKRPEWGIFAEDIRLLFSTPDIARILGGIMLLDFNGGTLADQAVLLNALSFTYDGSDSRNLGDILSELQFNTKSLEQNI